MKKDVISLALPLFLLYHGHSSKVPYLLHPAPYITLMYLRRYIMYV